MAARATARYASACNLFGHLKFDLARKRVLLSDYGIQRHSLPPYAEFDGVIVVSGRHYSPIERRSFPVVFRLSISRCDCAASLSG
jgi:hypothetical protein